MALIKFKDPAGTEAVIDESDAATIQHYESKGFTREGAEAPAPAPVAPVSGDANGATKPAGGAL